MLPWLQGTSLSLMQMKKVNDLLERRIKNSKYCRDQAELKKKVIIKNFENLNI